MAGKLTGAVIDESWYQRPEEVPDQVSAGGVVVRDEGEQVLVALAREQDYLEYVLPKGHVEPGEDVETAARREIAEETGITDLRLIDGLGVKGRLSFDKRVWKMTHYFLFATEQVDAVPEDTAHHTFMEWFPIDGLPDMFWPEQRELLEESTKAMTTAVR